MTRETPGAAAAPELLQAQLAEALQQLHALGARMTGLEARMTGAEASRGGDGGATARAASNGECERSPPPAPRSLAGSGSMDFLQSHQQLVLPQPGPGQRIPGRGRGGGAPTAADALLPRLPGRPPLAPSSTLAVPHEAEVPMATTRMVMAQIVSPGDSMGLDVCTVGCQGAGCPCWRCAGLQQRGRTAGAAYPKRCTLPHSVCLAHRTAGCSGPSSSAPCPWRRAAPC